MWHLVRSQLAPTGSFLRAPWSPSASFFKDVLAYVVFFDLSNTHVWPLVMDFDTGGLKV